MKNISCLLCLVFCCLMQIQAQSAHTYLRSGDQSYEEKDFVSAEEEYRKALEEKGSTNGSYNLGNAIYEQERFEEAVKHYEDAAGMAKNPTLKSKAYHNLGNTYMKTQEFDKSIEAYKNSLRLSPKDVETKYNLALAQKRLVQQQKQEQQQQQQQQSDEDQENQDQQDQQQQEQQENENQEQQEQQQNQENQDQQDQQQQQEEQQEGQEPQEEKNLNKEEARRLLQIMEEEERKVQEKLKKMQTEPNKSDKDW